ncbi:2OG-Fe(II) Oxygenase [Corallococcus coralloides DSM 2259]|uniref:2OG-Fe(II) Oxygenase n=1 Tax=Corallococcus coralloides (strain ATCC 25202 / DSM 2259 / NBRC 100086 / M2) TaxID=1144275 RepID=H8MUM2_CORCM|nr:hypothetical protein [Corallococcus coralloides]AFE06991.1 2OG-Fe(II) Oxygenase [Corallococcus coralloides DSM 2259]
MRVLPNPGEELDTGNPLILTVEHLLSGEECHALIERIEREGPTAAPITTSSGPACDYDDLKRLRAVVTRDDKTVTCYLAVLHVASMLLWLR